MKLIAKTFIYGGITIAIPIHGTRRVFAHQYARTAMVVEAQPVKRSVVLRRGWVFMGG